MRRTGRAREFVWLWKIPTLPVFPAFLRHVVKNRPNEAATFAHAHTREPDRPDVICQTANSGGARGGEGRYRQKARPLRRAVGGFGITRYHTPIAEGYVQYGRTRAATQLLT